MAFLHAMRERGKLRRREGVNDGKQKDGRGRLWPGIDG
jgi:hypothetical protein